MKILIVSPNFPPIKGGTGDWLFCLFRELKRRNIDVELFTTNDSEIRNYTMNHHLENIYPIINWNVFGIVEFIKVIKQKNPDILHLEYPGG